MKSLSRFLAVLLVTPLFACSSSGDAAPSNTAGSMSANASEGNSAGTTITGSSNTAAAGVGGAATGTTSSSLGSSNVSATAAAMTGTGPTGSGVTSGSGGAASTETSQANSSSASASGDGTSMGPPSGMTVTTATSTTVSTATTASTSTSTSTTGGVAACESGPLTAPLPDCSPMPVPDTGDFHADCVARINQFRWECQCLPPLERWVEAEDCADQQAEYDAMSGEAHAGIRAKICEPSNAAQNECLNYGPSFGIIDFCFQQMWDEGPGEDFQVHGHYLNMSDPSSSRVGCGRYVAPNGDVTSVQNFQ